MKKTVLALNTFLLNNEDYSMEILLLRCRLRVSDDKEQYITMTS